MNKHIETLKAYQAWQSGEEDMAAVFNLQSLNQSIDWAIVELSERPTEHQLMEQARTIKELQCHVERLRFALGRYRFDSLNQTTAEYRSMMKAANEIPTQSLAEIRAEAVESFVREMDEGGPWAYRADAIKYAAAIRQEAE